MKICKDCKWWLWDEFLKENECINENVRACVDSDSGFCVNSPEDFGCIHFEPKEEDNGN